MAFVMIVNKNMYVADSRECEKVQQSVTPDQKAVFLEADSVLYPLTHPY